MMLCRFNAVEQDYNEQIFKYLLEHVVNQK